MTLAGRRALVTGGAGFIGSHLVDRLLAEGAHVRVLDNFATGRRENLAHADGIDLLEASVVDPEACRAACEGVDVVFHQAALSSVARSVSDPRASHDACASGTLNMLAAAAGAGVERFVYAGSSSAYGDTAVLPKHEGLPTHPRSPYAVAKLAGELYAQAFPGLFGLETVVLRYFSVFGPRQDPGSPYSAVIPLFLTAAVTGRAPTICGDGGQTRDFTFVDNVVDANLLAATGDREAVAGEVFNVGCGESISVKGLWERIRQVVGTDLEARHTAARKGEVRDSLADLTRSRQRLGYAPRVGLDEGLERTAAWIRENAGA